MGVPLALPVAQHPGAPLTFEITGHTCYTSVADHPLQVKFASPAKLGDPLAWEVKT